MSSSIEAEIWGEPAATASTGSVRDRLSMAQPVPENFYERCTHGISGDRCDVCRAIRERGAAEPAPIPTASQTVVAQPFVPTPAAEPVPEVVRRAQTLAKHIAAREKLLKRISGLELSLETARRDLREAEEARIAAQTALKALVEDDAQENAK